MYHTPISSISPSPLHIIPRKLQSRYRRHLLNFKRLFQRNPRSHRSLNQSSRFTIHVVQEFYIGPIQFRQNVFETNIVVVHDHIPQIPLTHSSLLRARYHSRHLYCRLLLFTSPFISLSLSFFAQFEKLAFSLKQAKR